MLAWQACEQFLIYPEHNHSVRLSHVQQLQTLAYFDYAQILHHHR